MTDDFDADYPAPAAGRPLWLVTLADLALLLVGFFVLLQALKDVDGAALARGMRQGFGMDEAVAAMPVAANAMTGFAPGEAILPQPADGLLAWAHDAARDPRVTLTVTGHVDGTAADVDPLSRSPAVLAADRARAVAAAIAAAAPGRLAIATAAQPGPRGVTVTLAFAGDPVPPTRKTP